MPPRGWRSSLLVNSYYLMAANVVMAAFGFLFWTAAARLHPPGEVGLAAAVLSVVGLVSMLSGLGLDYAMVRFLPDAADPQGIVNSALTIGVGQSRRPTIARMVITRRPLSTSSSSNAALLIMM